MGKLYLCPTPIGNLEDITIRVLETLKDVDLVAAEDTRRTARLFARHGISRPMMSYREENRVRAGRKIVERMEAGEDVALVSDAGTPGLSDPGTHLVEMCLERGIEVVSLPGPSAAVSALVASGLPTARFSFEGFLPRKKGQRRRALEDISSDERTLVFYESPSRAEGTLSDIVEVLGDRRIALVRELTKLHEEIVRGRVSEVLESMGGSELKGEIVIVVEGSREKATVSMEEALKEVDLLRQKGLSLKDAVSEVASRCAGLSKSRLYNEALRPRRST